ncbi:YecA family protein [Bacillus sp. FJAT-28004]|uniref:YecA family protein n=1 Tax=Bacillus sp. FJAT-28004 TaxID=1679165 RepID=UPI0006B569FE|nr:SEC-C metal-binding domain-containing protein [Bacillus sp. FJAT-28004]
MTTKQDKAMEKFWPLLTYPLSYADALSTLSKQQLTKIRTNLDISNLSSLNKQGLVEKLSEMIPGNLEMATRYFDHNRLKLVQKIVKNEGIWDKPLLELQQYEYFRERGILFPGTVDGKQVVMMPVELLESIKSGELLKEHSNLNRNTEWIRLTQGLLYYYGTLTIDQLKSFVISEDDHPLAQDDIMNILFAAQDYYEQFSINENGYISDYRVVDPETIVKDRDLRHDLDYCPFTKQQLLKAGEADYVERNSHYMNLVRYVLERYEIDREEAYLMAEECSDAARNGDSLASVIELAQNFIEIPNVETMRNITDLLVPLMNSTKQWAIKGYSPEELSAKRANVSMVLNNVPNQAAPTAQAEVIDIQSKKKIGRNDPCSCGSGKKFKKCCG